MARNEKDKARKRLADLLAMMGSSIEAEREAARRKIDEYLAKYRKNWNDLSELMQGGGQESSWDKAAWDENRTAEQTAGDAIDAGLPSTAVKYPPNVLELVHFIFTEYLDMKVHEYVAAALWVLHTYVFEYFTVSPRLALTSPVNGCGKTTGLVVIEQLAFRPERMDNATPAVLYHLIDRMKGTVLVDEADNMGLRENGILRAVLNSGHDKGGNIRRIIKGAPKKFNVFAPMAIAAIGSLPMPLMRRSVIIHMEKSAIVLKRFDTNDSATMRRLNIVYRFIQDWARSKPVLDINPDLPKDLRNRVADNWRPLIAIADSFGPAWSQQAREAAIAFAHAHHDEEVGVVLLSDIRDVFNRTSADRMTSADLILALLDIEESGWSEYRGLRDDQAPRKLTAGEMARLLRPFGIRPRSIWPLAKRAKARAAPRAIAATNSKLPGSAIARQHPAQRHTVARSSISVAEARHACRWHRRPKPAYCQPCAGVPGQVRDGPHQPAGARGRVAATVGTPAHHAEMTPLGGWPEP